MELTELITRSLGLLFVGWIFYWSINAYRSFKNESGKYYEALKDSAVFAKYGRFMFIICLANFGLIFLFNFLALILQVVTL